MDRKERQQGKQALGVFLTSQEELTDQRLQALLQQLRTREELTDDQLSQVLLQLLRIREVFTDPERKVLLSFLAKKETLTDAELLELLVTQTDREGYFPCLFMQYQDPLWRYATKLACNREDAEEIAQDALHNAYHDLSGDGYTTERIRALRLKNYLYDITFHEFCDFYKSERRRKELFTFLETEKDSPLLTLMAELREQPEDTVVAAQGVRAILQLLQELPERKREALRLRCFEGLSEEEIAAQLQRPLGTIKSDISRGKASLRRWLEALQLLPELPEHQREALRLRYFEGFSYQKIATQLDRSLGTIKRDIEQGKDLLLELLDVLKKQSLEPEPRTRKSRKPRAQKALEQPLEEEN